MSTYYLRMSFKYIFKQFWKYIKTKREGGDLSQTEIQSGPKLGIRLHSILIFN